MDVTVVNVLVGLLGLGAVLTVLVQLGKHLIPSVEDANGNEIGPRRWMVPALLVIGLVLGIFIGFVRKDYQAENGLMFMTAWGIAGFLVAATSSGIYKGLSSIIPGVFDSDGWLGGNK